MAELQLVRNAGFATGTLDSWTAEGDVIVEASNPENRAHTGRHFTRLRATSTTPASISQTIFVPILPLTTFKLIFWLKKRSEQTSDIIATVTPVGSSAPILTVDLPASSNPLPSIDDWLAYATFSDPVLVPLLGMRVDIRLERPIEGTESIANLDQVFLVNNI